MTKIVLAKSEFESWLLGGIESIRDVCGIKADAAFEGDPESPRDAKGRLSELMNGQRRYSEVVDQPKLVSIVDLKACMDRCPSFGKLVRDFDALLREICQADD
ncbi:MAG: DUF4276 family protein [Candidatus Coatesbacteria bacterium]|nr:DUF4276 family protein [Candidatus Coatesbacteria bacterium]